MHPGLEVKGLKVNVSCLLWSPQFTPCPLIIVRDNRPRRNFTTICYYFSVCFGLITVIIYGARTGYDEELQDRRLDWAYWIGVVAVIFAFMGSFCLFGENCEVTKMKMVKRRETLSPNALHVRRGGQGRILPS